MKKFWAYMFQTELNNLDKNVKCIEISICYYSSIIVSFEKLSGKAI